MIGSDFQYRLPELKKTAVYRINKTKNFIQFKMIMLGTIAKIQFFVYLFLIGHSHVMEGFLT